MRRLAGLLGNEEAALARFTSKLPTEVSNRAAASLTKPKENKKDSYAAGDKKLPIMLSSVKVIRLSLQDHCLPKGHM